MFQRSYPRLSLAAALPLVWLLTLSTKAQEASANPQGRATFDQVGEIVENWREGQHLWVKGKLGVSETHLDQLEQWLEENASNWTIVLMQNAGGQRYENYRGMNAVEHALGKQLANRTDFGQLKDARTGESNGAFFILFLEERKFSYYGSEAFDRRSLGEKHWVGRLDKPAIAAMRGGGRIVDAAKDTVTSIESQLTQRIAAEATAKRRAAIERERALEEVRQLSGQIDGEIDRMEKEVGQIRDRQPTATGDLIQLPLASWRGSVKAIAEYAAEEDVANARKLADEVRKEIEQTRSGLAKWTQDAKELDRLQARLKGIAPPSELPSVQGHLSRAEEALASARENHAMAESLYRVQIEASDQALDRADAEIKAWRAAVLAEQRRLAARQKAIQLALIAAAILFLIGLIVLNRLRAPAKKEAEATLRDWKGQLKGKFDRLFQLMDRATIIVGPSSQLKNRGYDGTTLDLCGETIREVDELFIMSSATDFVVDHAENLVNPKSPWGGLINAFFSHRYRNAIALLGSQPIGFDREQGLDSILEPAGKINEEAAGRSLLGDPGDYEPFRMSFEELIARYDEKQAAAMAKVERLERGIDGLPLLLNELDGRLTTARQSAEQLAEAASEDRFFPMENLRKALLPAVSANLDQATRSGRADPVTAMENAAADAGRQLDSALRLSSRIETVRTTDFVTVEASAQELETLGRKVSWIDDRYAELTNRAEQLSTLMMDRGLGEELAEFEDDLLRLRGRIINCAQLSRRAEEEVASAIDAAETEAESTRQELARQLGVNPENVLAEVDLSPFTKIIVARKEGEAARIALDRGNVEMAQEDFSEIETLLEEVTGLLELSREVAGTHGERHQSLVTLLRETHSQEPQTASLLEKMIAHYDPAVLRFSSRTGREARGQDSIHDSLSRAADRLTSAEETLEKSALAYSKGHLIEAGGLLERADNEIGFARHQLSLVEDQHAALTTAETENTGDLAERQRRHGHLAESIGDRRTMMPTIEQYELAGKALIEIATDMGREKPNPFAAKLALEQQEKELNAIEQGIESDRTLFANAAAAVEDARQKLSESDRVVHAAQTDQIPDSARLESGIQRHQQLAEHLAKVEAVLNADHADWPSIQESTNATIEEIVKTRSLMESEVQAAQKAADELQRASSTLSDLQGWRSSHQVSFDRQAGWGTFITAREALARGEYPEAIQMATQANENARWELTSAERSERQAEAEAEAARRRQRAASFSSSSRSSFSSSGSSFGGGGGRSSGSSRSSFSSGSGTSRSGW